MSAVDQNTDIQHGVIRDFDYSEYLNESGIFDSAEELSDSRLIQVYGQTIYETRKESLPDRHTRREAFDEARKIVDNYNFGDKIHNGIYDKPEDLLVDAVNQGNLKDINLDVPWHPKVFYDEDKITTLPFQHSSAVLYSGRERHNFFDREYGEENVVDGVRPKTIDHMFNPDSVFEQGHFKAGNRHRDLGKVVKQENIHEWGIYTADIHQAESYASPIIAEFEIPSEHIVFTKDDGKNSRFESLEEYFSKHDSPEEARVDSGFIMKVTSNREKQPWNPHIDLEDVNGVWDPEYFPNTMHFLPLDEYARRIQEDFEGAPEVGLEQFRTSRQGYTFRRPRGHQYDYTEVREEADVMAEIENEAAMAVDFFSKANSSLLEESVHRPKDEIGIRKQLGATTVRNALFANESMDVIEQEASRYLDNPQIEEKKFMHFQESDTEGIEQTLEDIKQGSLEARKHVLESVEEGNVNREKGLEMMEDTLKQNIPDLYRLGMSKQGFIEFAKQIDSSWFEFKLEKMEDLARNIYDNRVEPH